MTGPYHYKRAEEILAEIQATNAVSNEADTALAIQGPGACHSRASRRYPDRPQRPKARVARRRRGQARHHLTCLTVCPRQGCGR
jgi:hypothetical protein